MSASSPSSLLWTFVAGILAVAILLSALGAALVIYQQRYVRMHRNYAQRLLQAQEEERAWVAREVHDDALQRIALMQRDFASVKDIPPELSAAQAHRVSAVQGEMDDLIVVLRGLAHRLHPALIEKGGLKVALEGLAGEIERTYGLTIERRLPERVAPLEPARALAIYRIAQEALRNVATHSGAKHASLALTQDAAATELAVHDNGAGFDARSRRPSDGLGLIGMRERAHLAGGTVAVISRPSQGTMVRATFPVRVESGE
ncbi:MAG TPA: ATP-binding protein [Gemmatimonadales bacterium]|nr:ATP-binding protein [Gemmatimonadales bacterium]